jgi:uncharacterized membrane protein
MTWRSSTTPLDRFFACLPYLLPLMDALVFGQSLFREFPLVGQLFLVPLTPFLVVYGQINSLLFGFGGLILFLALFFLVVRNESISHFIRFNTMQSIIIGIALSLFSIVWSYILGPALSGTLIQDTLFNVVFLGVVAVVIYSIVQCILGKYAEIPTLSEAAYMQVR